MYMKVKLDKDAYMPTTAHYTDAGYDLRTPIKFTLPPRGNVVIDTGVHIQLPPDKCAVIISKSGLNNKHGITSTGLVDEGFTGSIKVALHNHTDHPYVFEKGDMVSQFFITDYYDYVLMLVDELDKTERGDNGYGSSGR